MINAFYDRVERDELLSPFAQFEPWHGCGATGGPIPPFWHWERDAASVVADAGWASKTTAGTVSTASATRAVSP